MRKTALEKIETQPFEKLELLYTLLKTGEKGALALCICNSPAYRKQLEADLAQRLKKDRIDLHTLELKPGIISIVRAIKEKIERLSPEPGWRLALSVSSIESAIPETEQKAEGRPQALNSLNLQRDFFIDFPHPIALWLPEWVAQLLPVKAPDFWVVRTSVFEFRPPGEEMREYARAVGGFTPFFDSLEDMERRIRIYQKMIAGLGDSRETLPSLLLELGKLFWVKGELATARAYLEQGLQIAQEGKDKEVLAALLHGLGIMEQTQGNPAAAEKLYRNSLKIVEEMGDKVSIAGSLNQLGRIEQKWGNLGAARELYQRSLKITGELGDKEGIAISLHNLAAIEQEKGNLEAAHDLNQRSLKINEEVGDKEGIASSLHQWGIIEQKRGNLEAARELYNRSMKIAKELGNKAGIAHSLGQLGIIEQKWGNLEAAFKLFAQALAIFSSAGYAEKEIALGNLEKLRQEMGAERFEKALKEANIELPPLTRESRKVFTHRKTSEKKNYD